MASQRPQPPVIDTDPVQEAQPREDNTQSGGLSITSFSNGAGMTDVVALSDDGDKKDTEDLSDGVFRQVVTKNGAQVLVTWTRAEELKVVRKADFLFLPIFTVSIDYPLHCSDHIELY